MKKRFAALCTAFGALLLSSPSFAESLGDKNDYKASSSQNRSESPSPSPLKMVHGGGPTIVPVPRRGNKWVEESRARAAEARKLNRSEK